MTTTTEQSIAALVEIGGQNLSLPQQIANTATAKIAAVSAAFTAAQNSMEAVYYVEQTAGDDNNLGTEAAPLKSVGKALALTPSGGSCFVRLLSNYHVSGADIVIVGRRLHVSGANGIMRDVTHEPYIAAIGATNYRNARCFAVQRHGGLELSNVRWIMPEAPAGSAGLTDNPYAGVFSRRSGTLLAQLQLTGMHLLRTATSSLPVINVSGMAVVLDVSGVTYPDQPNLGKWIAGITNAAGTDPATKAGIVTNLALI